VIEIAQAAQSQMTFPYTSVSEPRSLLPPPRRRQPDANSTRGQSAELIVGRRMLAQRSYYVTWPRYLYASSRSPAHALLEVYSITCPARIAVSAQWTFDPCCTDAQNTTGAMSPAYTVAYLEVETIGFDSLLSGYYHMKISN